MQDLKILLVQFSTVWQDPAENRTVLERLIRATDQQVDLIVLPEMFSTGFSMESGKLAEPMNGPTHSWMIALAKELNVAICGSLIIEDEDAYHNRFVWVNPNQETIIYDKRHLFRMADEHGHYSAGQENVRIEFKGWRLRPQVCYDLRFPVWARNKMIEGNHDYDVLINVANWPEARVSAWDALLKARAIENHAYAVGVNRVGDDGKGIAHCGHSAVYDPKGNALAFLGDEFITQTVSLSYDDMARYRKQFPAQLDADDFEIVV